MSVPTVIPAGQGEVIGDAPDRRVEMLADGDELHATWTRFGPRRDGASPHVHALHTDLFYVLAGELTVRLGPDGDERTLAPGTLACIPPLVVHGFRNASDDGLRYLNLHAPGAGFADYMRGLRDGRPVDFDQADPPPDGGRPATEAQIVAATSGVEVGDLRIVEEHHAPPNRVSVAEAEAPGDQWLYVLDGELAITADGEVVAGAGAWVHVPAGAAHALTSAPGASARYLRLTVTGG